MDASELDEVVEGKASCSFSPKIPRIAWNALYKRLTNMGITGCIHPICDGSEDTIRHP